MRLSYPYSTQSNNFFGFREHGNFESKSPLTQFDTSDGQPCYKFFKNFTLHDGHTLTTTDPCRGLYIYVDGDAYIGGTISMTNRGIYSPPTGEYANGYTPLGMHTIVLQNLTTIAPTISPICTVRGKPSTSFSCGGGGDNSTGTITIRDTYTFYVTGKGGCSGIFSGGAGAGGTVVAGGFYHSQVWGSTGTDAQDYGGAGGLPQTTAYNTNYNSTGLIGGGGSGNPGYFQRNYVTGEALPNPLYTGTGGVLYLVVRGNITTSSTHLLTSVGHIAPPQQNYGGDGSTGFTSYLAGCGTGGGLIVVLHAGSSPTLTYNVAGGTYAGAGSFRKYQILK